MHRLEKYLRDMHEVRATGAATKETSYYPALHRLLSAIGEKIKPKVRCVMNLKNQGAGLPDGGLFTPDQMSRGSEEPAEGQNPSRGVIECKAPKEDAWKVAESPQVSRYWDKYRQVLVTNYRDFVLIAQDDHGEPVVRETFRLAENEKAFWEAAAHPAEAVERLGERFVEYLQRLLLHEAPLSDPKDVAWFLASYARDARARLESAELPALDAVRTAFQEALGLTFEGDKGEHFFRSSLVQTLFYGVFSAWVLWHRRGPKPNERFDWEKSAKFLHVPILRKLFHELAEPGKLEEWRLDELLTWTAGVLNRVDRPAFFAKFQDAEAVQYFYEPFLEQFDPELHKQLGVWYTPPEIVKYMVARVDAVLKEDLGRPDGLADPSVFVLDPCCGTGAYLAEVLRTIATTLQEKGEEALLGGKLKEAVQQRVFGFELLPAPFVVAHLQIGLFLQSLGTPLDEAKRERAAVFLTNALTGWEPPTGPKQKLLFPELEDERDNALNVKQQVPILVVLGNPPYNAFAGVSQAEEQGLVNDYKEGLARDWGIRKFNLDDLYIRFFRVAERRIVEQTGQGILCFISNFSYLTEPSFVVLRQRLLAGFDRLWIDCLNGDSRETGKLTPEGKPDPSVFSTEANREGIRVGTAINLAVRLPKREARPTMRFRDLWGTAKRAELLASLAKTTFSRQYRAVRPMEENRFSFRPTKISTEYLSWPRLVDLCALPPSNGLMEKRGGALIDIDVDALTKRMKAYFDKRLTWEAYAGKGYGLTNRQARFDPRIAREKLLAAETFDTTRIVRYLVRPFDLRWCYYTGIRPVWNEPRPRLWAQCWPGNRFLLTRFNVARDEAGPPVAFASVLIDDHHMTPDAVAIPFQLRNGDRLARQEHATLFDHVGETPEEQPIANLSKTARGYLSDLRCKDPDADENVAALLWFHALAIGHAHGYQADHADGIRQDWPRIPLPMNRKQLETSAALGKQVAALLDPQAPVGGVTGNRLRKELKLVGVETRTGGGYIDATKGELDITVRWGIAGKDTITMPGKGKLSERSYSPVEMENLRMGAADLGMKEAVMLDCFGESTFDIHLNDIAFWRNVPAKVWGYTLGGYQVLKKWLSYREKTLLGRGLKLEEVSYVGEVARRIAALLLLGPALDANYQAVKAATYPWKPE